LNAAIVAAVVRAMCPKSAARYGRIGERFEMASTTILLREDVEALGGRGEVVKVKAGYARNYLLPQGLATLATKGNVKQIQLEREALLKKAAVEKATAEAQKDQMGVIELAFERKAGEGGTLFGSVTSMDIAEALQAKGYEVDRRRIALRDAIKETGEYVVRVKLHREVVLEVPVTVTAEGGEEVSAAEAKPAKKGRKAKAETVEETVAESGAATERSETTPDAE
jgi:large subunit ribosomal protein L9